MSRNAHFLVGLGILLLSAVWCILCLVGFIGTAIGKDSDPRASLHDSSFLIIFLVGAGGLICGLWFAFKSFRRALRAPRLDPPTSPVTPERQPNLKRAEETLAHLVKKTDEK